jgi:chromosome segregation ATPase
MFNDWKSAQKEITSLQIQYYRTAQELADSQRRLNALNLKTASLETNNLQLSQEKQKLEEKLAILEMEKQVIQTKFNSIKGLKQAIRQVKMGMHGQRIQLYLARKAQQKQLDAQELAMGNRGYLTKGAQSTSKQTIRIEVKPAN